MSTGLGSVVNSVTLLLCETVVVWIVIVTSGDGDGDGGGTGPALPTLVVWCVTVVVASASEGSCRRGSFLSRKGAMGFLRVAFCPLRRPPRWEGPGSRASVWFTGGGYGATSVRYPFHVPGAKPTIPGSRLPARRTFVRMSRYTRPRRTVSAG